MIALASDHAGFALKEAVREYLAGKGIDIKDYGVYSNEVVDYPLAIRTPCLDIGSKTADKGIFFCGTGIGVSIAANKHSGVRAACVTEAYSARLAREHNDANVLCLGGRILSKECAFDIVDVFLNTPFSGEERHKKRIDQIAGTEK